MPDHPSFPTYHFPFKLSTEILLSFIKQEERKITDDAKKAIQCISPPIKIIDKENIPSRGPAIITSNHYSRKGFFIAWAALGIAACLEENQIWLMTSAWTKRTRGIDQLRTALTKYIFKRLANMYGFVTTPPLPLIAEELPERAESVRKLIRILRENPEKIFCIAPEGQDFKNRALGLPPQGTGKLIHQIQGKEGCIVPVGIWEENGSLILKFGKSYVIEEFNDKQDIDRFVSKTVMGKISEQTPARLH